MNTNAESTAAKPRRSDVVPLWLYAAGALFLGISALFGGGSLLLDPSGSSMGMPLDWLIGTPFTDYFLPGLVLFGVLGGGSFIVLYGILRGTAWAWPATLALGLALIGWIVVQILLIRLFHPLHVVYGSLGLLLVLLALMPSVRTALAN